MYVSIFSILAFDNSSTEYVDNGTGFFINADGYMISAGHVFKDEKRKYFALINDQKYPIDFVFKEYIDQDQQKAPFYKDLFIGRISFDSEKIEPMIFSTELTKDSKYIACGYSLRKCLSESQETKTIDDLWSDDSDDYISEQKRLKYYELAFQCSKLDIFRAFNGDIQCFTNGFTIEMNEIPAGGLSGGPIVLNKMVKGILIAMDNCITSKYITSRLKEYEIDFLINS